ncbi:MAG TPA: efflux RND transporter periplasmic adaptor subunit [Stellaceae bacterium]|nr:efflux RND transporter periplasmic adaptor subunit [Stellaceae bacterium]
MIKKISYALVILVVVGIGWIWYSHHKAGGQQAQPRGRRAAIIGNGAPVAVDIGAVQARDVPIYLTGIGTVQAFNSVAVTSRVDGQLQKLDFIEGQEVKTGDVLAEIDPRPFQATLDQDLATLKKDQASLANARLDLVRDVTLVKKAFASQQTVDTQQALVNQDIAQVAADEAQVEAARVQLAYCTITSPISGRTGIRNVDVGNVIHASDSTGIVTVTQIHPISVVFTLPADDLPQVAAGQATAPLVAAAMTKDTQTVLEQGMLAVFDNQIDQTTGTIKLKATFPNTDSKLWPGQFVNVRLLVDTRHAALTVPSQVSQVGPNGSYAWVVQPDNTVKMQDITTTQADKGDIIVETGLKAGDKVVVDGQYRLQPGSHVVQQSNAPIPENGAPAGKRSGAAGNAGQGSQGQGSQGQGSQGRHHRPQNVPSGTTPPPTTPPPTAPSSGAPAQGQLPQ